MTESYSTLGRFERECVTCGARFAIGTGRGQARKYCGPNCIPERVGPTKPCAVEGCHRKARSNTSAYCEAHYYQIRRNGRLGTKNDVTKYRQCQYCGEPTEAGRKFCSSGCEARHRRGNPKYLECLICKAVFDPRSDHGPDAKVCGETCRRERERRAARDYYAKSMQTARGRDRARNAGYRRRARKRAATAEHVSRDEVMRRGKWRCHLCGKPIPRRAEWPEPMFGTVDHVLPLAAGGLHSYANCKPAHLSCNCKKGSKPVGQLGLCFAS